MKYSEWNAIDLHMHTSVGVTGDGKYDVIQNFTYLNYVKALLECDIKLAAITNHNHIDLVNFIICRFLAKKRNINVLFGVEIDTNRESGQNYHFVSIFEEELSNCCRIENWINTKTEEKKKTKKVRFTSEEIVELIKKYNVVIIPHGDKNKGLLNRASQDEINDALKKVREGFIRVFDSPSDWKLERIKKLIEDGTIEKIDDNFGGVLFSDNRDWNNYKKNFRDFYMNAEPTFKGFLHSITNPTQRFSTKDLIPIKSRYISKIQIRKKSNNAIIDDCDICLSSGYNCIIGKSGSGKSLLHFLIEKEIKGISPYNINYLFSENNYVYLYDENNQLIKANTINIGIGSKIFDKIVTASNTKNSNDMYSVIRILNKDFSIKQVFNSFAEKYREYIQKYVLINETIKSTVNRLKTNINSFNSNISDLNSMKNIKTFEISIPENVNYEYSEETILNINSIYGHIKSINALLEYFKDKNVIRRKLQDFTTFYIQEIKKIYINHYRELLLNKKREIIRNSLTIVNKGISANAEKKTSIISSMKNNIDLITKDILNLYLLKLAKDRFDLSINLTNINNYGDVITNSGITFSEKINPDSIKKLDIKDNEIFYTRGIQGKLLSKYYDFTDFNESKEVIDKYIDYGQLNEVNIAKMFKECEIVVDVYFDGQNVKELNPGSIAKKYIKTYFENELSNGVNTIILYDQIENDVDKTFISDDLLKFIDDMKQNTQLIIVTHDPIIAVNADPINYIEAIKDNNGIIKYRSFKPESYEKDELNTIACCVDGSKTVIKERYEIYEGDKTYEG